MPNSEVREKEEKEKQNNSWLKKKKPRAGKDEVRPGSSKTLLHDSREN